MNERGSMAGHVLESVEADIAGLALDAIVNAANQPLIMGGGVDGAIRTKAGPEMEVELRGIGRCPAGSAVITRGYRLPARHVIHTVAPVWRGDPGDDEILAGCYRSALRLADTHALSSIAFPCIGTGIFAWPPDRAAKIAFRAVTSQIAFSGRSLRVVFCCFSAPDRERYDTLIAAMKDARP